MVLVPERVSWRGICGHAGAFVVHVEAPTIAMRLYAFGLTTKGDVRMRGLGAVTEHRQKNWVLTNTRR